MGFTNSVSMVLIGLIFSACGGGGGGDSTQTPTEVDEIKTGYFKDSAVSGLDYSSCNEAKTVCIEKMTGVDGDFEYREGDTARFKLGDLVIAEGPAKPLLIPADVSQDEESSKKLGQLLMTLDEDNDPLTGIKIPYAVNQNAKDIVFEPDADFYALTQDDVKLQELVNGVNGEEKTLVSEVEVEEHLELSARLRLMREFSDPIKHYLGDKYYKEDSKFNVDILNISPKRRLLLGIWNEKKMALLSESKKFSDQTTADEKKRAELMYAISVAKGIADSAIMIVDLKKVDLGDLGVTGIQIVGTVASLEMNGNALSSGVDIGVESDVFKGVLGGVVGGLENSNGGFNGFVRGGAKDLIGAGLGYSGAPDVFKGALEAGWPMVDTIWENMDTHGMKIGLQNLKNLDFDTLNNLDINQLSLIADGIEKSLQIAVNLSAANQVTDSRNMELTVMAAIEYLEAFYKSAGDAQYMSDEYDLPIRIDAAYKLLNNRLVADGSWWDYVFRDDGDVIIDKTLFLEYVSSSLSAISLSTKTYIQQLSPSVTDAEAILTPLPQKVCNGVTFELRATTDKGFEQDPNDLSNILWQTPSEVTSEVSGLTNRVTFNQSGYYSIGITMDIAIEGQNIGVGDFSEVLVQPCMDMSERVGLENLRVKSVTDEYIEYEASLSQGYLFNGWKNSTAKVSAESTYRYNYSDFDTVGTLSPTFTIPVPDGPLTHNGLTYDVVTSPYTGRIWLDRNLGATKVCADSSDTECFGDLYQQGRKADGHEKRGSSITNELLATDITESSSFVVNSDTNGPWYKYPWKDEFDNLINDGRDNDAIIYGYFYDVQESFTIWHDSIKNNVCPDGFIVPSAKDYESEISGPYSFENFLKLPVTDLRSRLDGSYTNYTYFAYWASDAQIKENDDGNVTGYTGLSIASGLPVRCMYNEIMPFAPSKLIFLNDTETANIDVNVTYEDLSSISYEIITQPFHGTLSGVAPNYVYTPNSGTYNKYDSFQYRANDGLKKSNIADVNITMAKVSGTINHNGDTYDTVVSELTGRTWLDRNLGAKRVCLEIDDSECLGDYYQWGRDKDGHEKVTSATTTEQALSIDSVGSLFISSASNEDNTANEGDWAFAEDSDGVARALKWAQTDGSSVCPSGYRVPTIEELSLETPGNNQDNFESMLKIPSSGIREIFNWFANEVKQTGALWSTDVNGTKTRNRYFNTSESYSALNGMGRGNGINIRCIKAE